MKHQRVLIVLTALLSLVIWTGCKSHGMAVTEEGQLAKINIDVDNEQADGKIGDVRIEVSNRGVSKLGNVEFTVEMPEQLVVLDESHGDGMNLISGVAANGDRLYHYMVGDIEVGQESVAKFQVRTAFGTVAETDAIKVTMWQKDLPSEKLIETRTVKLRR